jgi:hypothetical protein
MQTKRELFADITEVMPPKTAKITNANNRREKERE